MKLTIEGLKESLAAFNGKWYILMRPQNPMICAEVNDPTTFTVNDLTAAKAERDAAIKAVTDKAVGEGWDKDEAYGCLVMYAKTNKKFWSWEFRELYASVMDNQPHDARAWGHIYRRAVREGIIRRGTEERADPTRHATMTKCWEVV